MIRQATPIPRARAIDAIPAAGYIRMSSNEQDASPEQQRQKPQSWPRTDADHPRVRRPRNQRRHPTAGLPSHAPRRPREEATSPQSSAGIKTALAGLIPLRPAIIFPLREAGVWLITKTQGVVDWNTFTGRLIYSILQEGKHKYLLDLSRNVLRARIASARKGQLIVQPAYGYDRVFYDEAGETCPTCSLRREVQQAPKGWTVKIEPSADAGEKVATVKWIMDTFANGDCSIRWIAKDLNQRGVPAPRGRGWNANTVRYILAHRVYLGQKMFRRAPWREVSPGRRRRRNSGIVNSKAANRSASDRGRPHPRGPRGSDHVQAGSGQS